MNSGKIAKFGAGISILGGLLIIFLDYFNIVICPRAAGKGQLCIYDAKIVAEPLFFFLISLFIIFLVLIFVQEQIFIIWKKFAIPYIILSTLLLIFIGNSGGSWGVGSIIDSREGVALILSGLFLVISIFIIAIKSWKLRKQQ